MRSPKSRPALTRTPPARRRRWVGGIALAAVAPLLAVGVAGAPAATAAPAGCITEVLVTTCRFSFTGAAQDWTVPDHVRTVTFTVTGAAGGSANDQPGGRGRGTRATLVVTPGTTYRLHVGGKGGSDDDAAGTRGVGGWNGGGNGAGPRNPGGGGGGGASDIRTWPYDASHRILVGGGGGGAGSAVLAGGQYGRTSPGGHGGGASGNSALAVRDVPAGAGGGVGGSATGPGSGGAGSGGAASGGAQGLPDGCGVWGPGWPVAGGAGAGASGGAGGYLRSGWGGRRCDQYAGWGGGGGGGWYGGGGGGGGITGGAGGGGGSGYGPDGSTNVLGEPRAHGMISISYRTWVDLGGGPMTSAPTLATRGEAGQPVPAHDLFYLGANSQVVQRIVTDGVPGPEYSIGGVLYPGSTVAALWSRQGQRLDLFGRGPRSELYQLSFSWTTGWGAWHVVAPAGSLTSDAAVTSMRPDSLDVFFRGAGHDLQHLRLLDGRPQDPVSLGGDLVTGPAAITTDGVTRVVAGENEHYFERGVWVEHVWYDVKPGWTRNVNGSPYRVLSAVPALYSPAEARVDVALRNASSGLSWTRHAGSPVETTNAPSPAGSAPALITTPAGEGVVYLRGDHDRLVALGLGPL